MSSSSSTRAIKSKPAASSQRPQQALELMIGSLVGMVHAGRNEQNTSH